MRITFVESGGFTGLVREATVEADALTPREASELRLLVARTQGVRPGPAARGADATRYRIEIAEGRSSRVLEGDEVTLPKEVEPLVRFLRARSSVRPPR